MDSDDNPFSRITTDDLMKVLSTRFDSFVFVGSQTKNRSAQDLTFCTVGPFHSCIGLAETAKMLISAGGIDDE
jgi:hypothetical protein